MIMQLIKPINKINLTSFFVFKSLIMSLELCFLVYSLKMNIFSYYNYLIFTIVTNVLMNTLQMIEHLFCSFYFYNKEFQNMEEYTNAKLLLRINNKYYNSICNIYNLIMMVVSINLIVFSFIFVENVKDINESFIHGMIIYYIVLGFLSLIIISICIILLICILRMQRNTNQNINDMNTRVESLRSILNSFIPNDVIQNGLSMEIINKIKTSNEILEDVCSICLNKENKEIMILICNHNFHSECLQKWLVRNKKCPICRKEVLINDYEPHNVPSSA